MVNYPHKKKMTSAAQQERTVVFGKRGMSFEEDLQKSNEFYLAAGRAVIHKKPTPVQIVKVNYPKRAAAVITEAYFRTPSTTDFNGVFNGRYIDFEAKETSHAASFPLQNIHEHQIKHMDSAQKQGGIVFLLVKFSKTNEIYLLSYEKLQVFWQEYKQGSRRSIKKTEFSQSAALIPEGAYPRIDYLKIVEQLFYIGKNNKAVSSNEE